MKQFPTKILALSLALLYLVGCGGSSQPAGGGTKKLTKIKIASVSPLSAGGVAQGESIKLSVEVAVKQRKADLEAAGYDASPMAKDDQGKPEVATQIAADLITDKTILGSVGTLNSGTAKAIMAQTKDSGLVMISPSNTSNELTEKGYTNYNRVCFRDDNQGPSGARYAVKTLGAKTVWLVHDKTPYGQGLVENFQKEFVKLGGKVLGTSPTTDLDRDFAAVVTAIKDANPEFIFYGGLSQAGGPFVKQVRDKGIQAKIMGGDGFDDPDLVKLGGGGEGVYFTSLDAEMDAAVGKKYVDDYKAVSSGKDPQSYGIYSYDAANIIIDAIVAYGKAHNGQLPERADIAKAVRNTKGYKGLGGDISFDSKGDNPSSKVFVFQYKGGKSQKIGVAPQG